MRHIDMAGWWITLIHALTHAAVAFIQSFIFVQMLISIVDFQAPANFAHKVKSYVVVWRKLKRDEWCLYGNNQYSLMNCCGR